MRNIVPLIFLILFSFFLNCKEGEINHIKSENTSHSNEEKYFEKDTLPIKKYTSDSGNEIELIGSKSQDFYNLKIKTKNGKQYNYQIADSWYAASHSNVEWDNSEYLFIRQGCGTMCWSGKILNLTGESKIRDFPFYLHSDSIKNYIAFPDTINQKKLILQNLTTSRTSEIVLDLCDEAVMPILTIDTIYQTSNDKILIRYCKANSVKKEVKLISLP